MQLEWLIPLVVLGVWLLSSLIRNTEEDRRTNRTRPGERDRPPGARPLSRSTTEIDRFLEEVNRRRRQTTEGRGTPPATPAPPPVPAAAPPRPRPVAPPPAPRRPVPPTPTKRSLPERTVRPERTPTPAVPVAAVEVVVETPLQELPPRETAADRRNNPPVAAVVAAAKPVSVEFAQLVTLLQSPTSRRTAMLLKMVLDPPVCMRRRGR